MKRWTGVRRWVRSEERVVQLTMWVYYNHPPNAMRREDSLADIGSVLPPPHNAMRTTTVPGIVRTDALKGVQRPCPPSRTRHDRL